MSKGPGPSDPSGADYPVPEYLKTEVRVPGNLDDHRRPHVHDLIDTNLVLFVKDASRGDRR